MLETGQIVTGPGYGVVVSPGVRHLPELLSVTELTLVRGDIGTRAGIMEIFWLPVILTNINFIKHIKSNLMFLALIKSSEQH